MVIQLIFQVKSFKLSLSVNSLVEFCSRIFIYILKHIFFQFHIIIYIYRIILQTALRGYQNEKILKKIKTIGHQG